MDYVDGLSASYEVGEMGTPFFDTLKTGQKANKNEWLSIALLIILILLASLYIVYYQKDLLGKNYLLGRQLERHNAVMDGTAGNPWQYRILSKYSAEGFIQVFTYSGVGIPVYYAFLSLRVLQIILIFLLVFVYYRKLGLGYGAAFTGLVLIVFVEEQPL